jgi:hypothetical protein
MRWQKLGLVYCAGGEYEWAQSHAFIPTSLMLDEDRIRVYAAFLDGQHVGRVGFVDVDARDPRRVLRVSDRPALDIGVPGTFDERGVTPISVLEHEHKIFLYYAGWQLGATVRYYLFIGLAISEDGGVSFHRLSQVPLLDRSDGELFVRSAANVIRDGDKWKMWYIGGDRWIDVGGKQVPSYNLRYLESNDLTCWGKRGMVVLDTSGPDEFGFGRPFVIKEENLFRMWYSIRTITKGYRLGYAESFDGLKWQRRDDEIGIDVSENDWDSEMICFSCIQKTPHGTYMFYNGNNFGETGFGVALLKD